MLRSVLLGAAFYSLFSAAVFALPANSDEVVQQFSQAQQLSAEGKIDEAISIYQTA